MPLPHFQLPTDHVTRSEGCEDLILRVTAVSTRREINAQVIVTQ